MFKDSFRSFSYKNVLSVYNERVDIFLLFSGVGMEASTMASASRTLESAVTLRPKATTQGPLTQEPNRARGQRVDTQRAEPGILSHSRIVFSCVKTMTMTFCLQSNFFFLKCENVFFFLCETFFHFISNMKFQFNA